MSYSILIVDDDARIRTSLSEALGSLAEVRTAEDGERALAAVAADRPDVVLADVRMPGLSGPELLRLLRERAPEVDVLLMTAFEDLATVASAMRDGAVDFLVKPLDLHQLRAVLDRVIEDRRARRSATGGRPGGPARPAVPTAAPGNGNGGGVTDTGAADFPALVGRDPRMLEIFKLVGQIGTSRATAVIRGESGTGKELIARAIHSASPASDQPFVAVNCTALPSTLLESELFGHVRGSFTGATGDRKGRFAQAGRGTIFLDEIGDTSPEFQAKLLRVLQEHEFHPVGADRPQRTEARVIAATHRDLESMVAAGTFREDLYYRLRVVEITIPPLRARMADVPVLTRHLVAKAAAAAGRPAPTISADARSALLRHGWPGNVRELENCLTRAVVLATGDVIRAHHLALGSGPPAAPAGRAPVVARPEGLLPLEEVERRHVERVLEATEWHKTRSAEILGISRPRLDRIIERHGLTRQVAG